jgi:formylglycine-generating enzyme required for sulfatase activity
LSNCGATSESCCASLEVPGGTYYRTYNTGDLTSGPPDGGWPDEADPATITGLRIDKYLVTVGRFRQFVNAVLPADGGAGWSPPSGSGVHTHLNGGLGLVNSGATNSDAGVEYETGWDATDWNSDIDPTNSNLACYSGYQTWTNTASTQENLPINCVNSFEAYAFCIWDGGFLPSEAEWEYAAAGGSEQLEYPWGSTAPGTACPGTGCSYAIYDCFYPGGLGTCAGVANIAPVGTATLGAGVWGQLDLAGNIRQWNLDWYATYVDPCVNCAYLSNNSSRVSRGGDFLDSSLFLVPPSRGVGLPPADRYEFMGFRCARTP